MSRDTPASRTVERLYYDGECGVCHWAVGLVARLDPDGRAFRFAPLDGETFRETVGASRRALLPDSLVVHTADDRLLTRSDGLIYILRKLAGFWRLLARLVWIVPRPLRDFGYDLFARHRKRFAATPSGTCPVVPPALRRRFDP